MHSSCLSFLYALDGCAAVRSLHPACHVNTQKKINRFLQNKSLWSSITENKRISCYDFLCSAFDSAVYEKNLSRALEIPTCRVIPYFKFYLDKLRIALSSSKTFSFTSGSIEEICAKVRNFAIKIMLSF